ncbi:MAG: sugar ABC transporter permease [Caldilineaceae bacterium]|nr:sugar ABC transporter permease [Caldilineaceae bacterium]
MAARLRSMLQQRGPGPLSRLSLRQRRYVVAWTFLAPILLYYLVFALYPIALAVVMSVSDWKLNNPVRPFIGLQNYVKLASDTDFRLALANTVEYTVMYVPGVFVVSLIGAMALNSIRHGRALYRAIYFAPVMTAGIVVALIWKYMLHPSYGLANVVLNAVGLPSQPWLVQAKTAMASLVMIAVWESMGYQMVLFLAGLQGIPLHLYDSAKIDGANIWQRFVHITWPLLRPTVTFVLVVTVIGAFQMFTLAYAFGYYGGPGDSLLVAVMYIRHQMLTLGNVGYAAAMALVLFAIISIVTIIQLRMTRTRWRY